MPWLRIPDAGVLCDDKLVVTSTDDVEMLNLVWNNAAIRVTTVVRMAATARSGDFDGRQRRFDRRNAGGAAESVCLAGTGRLARHRSGGRVVHSRESDAFDPSQVHRSVETAAKRTGLSDAASAHWLRPTHVSHALDRGTLVLLVQATVGYVIVTTMSRYFHVRPNNSSSRYMTG